MSGAYNYYKEFINTIYSYKESLSPLGNGLLFHHDNDRYYVERTNEYTKDKFRIEVTKDDKFPQDLKFRLDIYKNDVKMNNNIYLESEETVKLLSLICTYYGFDPNNPLKCGSHTYINVLNFDLERRYFGDIDLDASIEANIWFEDVINMLHPNKLRDFILEYMMATNKTRNENQSNLPQQKTGKWINSHTTCSCCGWYMEDDVMLSPNMVFFKHCPECGAYMENATTMEE